MTSLKSALPTKIVSASTVASLFLGLGVSAASATDDGGEVYHDYDVNTVTNVTETEHLIIESTTVPEKYEDLRVGISVPWEVNVEVKSDENVTIDAVLNYSAEFSSHIAIDTQGQGHDNEEEEEEVEWVLSENDSEDGDESAMIQQTHRTTDYFLGGENSMDTTVIIEPGADLLPEQNASMSLTVIAREHVDNTEDTEVSTPPPDSSEPTTEPTIAPEDGDEEESAPSETSSEGSVDDDATVPGQGSESGDVIEERTITPVSESSHSGGMTTGGLAGEDSDGDSTTIETGVIPAEQSAFTGFALLGIAGIALLSGAAVLWRKKTRV